MDPAVVLAVDVVGAAIAAGRLRLGRAVVQLRDFVPCDVEVRRLVVRIPPPRLGAADGLAEQLLTNMTN